MESETERLVSIQEKNKLVSATELEWWHERKRQLEKAFQGARLRLDSFLLVIPTR
jgi:hypothetical protein